jgi:hypothetical protein
MELNDGIYDGSFLHLILVSTDFLKIVLPLNHTE